MWCCYIKGVRFDTSEELNPEISVSSWVCGKRSLITLTHLYDLCFLKKWTTSCKPLTEAIYSPCEGENMQGGVSVSQLADPQDQGSVKAVYLPLYRR